MLLVGAAERFVTRFPEGGGEAGYACPMRILFVHGLESHPGGSKVRALREQGFEVVAPDLRPALAAAADRAEALAGCAAAVEAALTPDRAPDVVVGSSWGGAVTGELVRRGRWSGPTVLLAPAVAKAGVEVEAITAALRAMPAPVVVVHDPTDDVVPFADSVALAGGSVTLRSVRAGGHRLMELVDSGALAALIRSLG